ncbi:MAG: glycosyltransferase family 4 protein [Candidatus Aenigmarchaeota archaeon]|nr:glycosyltransferase family 4 protein [Candidatus Aenigmarchaeota archaeon]
MKIAQLVPPIVPTPPKLYGGTERVASMLTEELVSRGHKVTLFATGDSKTHAKLRYLVKEATGIGSCSHLLNMAQVYSAYREADEFDIIHNHAGFFGIASSKFISRPTVTTMHNDYLLPKFPEFHFFRNATNFVFISKKQEKRMHGLRSAGVVYNATDTDEYTFSPDKEDYLLFLGNCYKHKGPDIAIRVAKRLGMKLIITGKYDPGRQEAWFMKNVAPHVDGKRIIFRKLIPFEEKLDLYQHARCVLFPIRWEEPFGLVMIESMACGTPVVAFGKGSVPEIIKHGETGFIADDYRQFLAYVKRAHEINPRACRRWVKRKFSIEVMADSYERVYRRILKSRR